MLDLGDGFYAFYAHMKPGCVQVRVRRRSRRPVLGSGNSGNGAAPHLHFHIMDTGSVLGSEGLPYVFRRMQLAGNIAASAIPDDLDGDFKRFLLATPQLRTKQFPLNLDVIDFER